jgi:hypothetical protein
MAALGFELTIFINHYTICNEAIYLLSQMVLLSCDVKMLQDQIVPIIMSFLKYLRNLKTPFEVESEH